MADFLEKLSQVVRENQVDLIQYLGPGAAPGEADLLGLVQDHWCALPTLPEPGAWAAYAVDGSISQIDLDNGSYLFIAQALCIGDNACEEPSADVQILPPATPRPAANRFADLMQRYRELFLANEMALKVPEGSVLYLDGALYGMLPQLYRTPVEGTPLVDAYVARVLDEYLQLMQTARARGVRLVAVSKTSREATHCKLWMRALNLDDRQLSDDHTDSGMIHRWTDGRPGVSVPVVLGTWGFTGGSAELLEREEVRSSPAIVSFFVRLADFDEALRIDVPAHQVAADVRLGDIRGEVLEGGVDALQPVIEILATDYGGLEVYNSLLYSVDREVRLKRPMLTEVYLPLISEWLGYQIRPNRSERRFM
jgi:hypothetical protein